MDNKNLKKYFPIYDKHPNLVYLDSAASSLKPKVVIEEIDNYYNNLGVNVHRGVYDLSYRATDLYENARTKIAQFINAKFEEVVFTRGCSSALNMVCMMLGENLTEGDEVISSELEHHSSVLPWLNLENKKKIKVKYIPLNEEGRITFEAFLGVLTEKTKVVCVNHVSNVLGYIAPIEKIIEECNKRNIITVIDGAQGIPHMKVDVKKLNCDFYCFSGHKMCGPTGIGVLYGKLNLLESLNPVEFGGDMADIVYKDSFTFKSSPYKFETGTPLISEAIGLGKAVEFLDSIGMEYIEKHENELLKYTRKKLEDVEGITIYNKTCETGILSFNIDGVHPHDAASIFDKNNVCIRAGHHCAQLITKWLGQISTLRASFYFYNDFNDCDLFVESVKEAIEFFGGF
jgi:cysteine desulfurase/selenocysteine lyase